MVLCSAIMRWGGPVVATVAIILSGVLLAWPVPVYAAAMVVQAGSGSGAPPASGPAAEPSTTNDLPEAIGVLRQHPAGEEHAYHTVEGVVVRITEHLGGDNAAAPLLLLRDPDGDTISVVGAATRVALGERIRVTGRFERDLEGNARIVAAQRGLFVLSRPAEGGASHSPRPGGLEGREWRPRAAGALGVSAAILLLGGIVVRNRRRSRNANTSIPLIVDLAALQASAPPTPAAPQYQAPARPTAGDLTIHGAEAAGQPAADNLPAEPAVRQEGRAAPDAEPVIRQVSPMVEPPVRIVESPLPRIEPPLRQAVPTVPGVSADPRSEPPLHQIGRAVPQAMPTIRRAEAEAAGGKMTEALAIPAHDGVHGSGNGVDLDHGTDAPLQLLPGMLEIVEGADGPPQICFFRSAALEVPEVTLGRAHGAPYRHVHLWAPSVSRMHACMRFEGGRWRIANLSEVNPLRINGHPLALREEERLLADGDHIQLGEVVLHYRENRQ